MASDFHQKETEVMKHLLQLWKKMPISHGLRVFLLRRVNDQFLIGVTGVIFNDKNEVLILKHSYRRVAWSLPGGYLQANEHPKQGLAREIEEETGFKVHVVKIISTKAEHDSRIDMCYFGVYKSGKFRKSDEVVRHKFVAFDKVPKLIEDQYDQILQAIERKKVYDRQQRVKSVKHFASSFFHRFTRSRVE